MATKKDLICGMWVEYDEEDRDGIYYLKNRLEREEAKTLLDAARLRGKAEFEDHYGHDWTLIYNRSTGRFTLVKRK